MKEYDRIKERAKKKLMYEGEPFFPHEIVRQGIFMVIVIIALMLLATYLPVEIGEPADAFNTPPTLYPEWYFLFLYGFIKWWTVDIGPIEAKTMGVLFPMAGMVIVMLYPFIDKSPTTRIRERPYAVILGVIMIVIVIYLTIYSIIVH